MKLTKSITIFLLLLATPSLTLAQTTVYSYQSGNFNAQNIWTYTNGGTDFVTGTPNADWNYVINPGHTITLTANSQIAHTDPSRTVTINGTLNVQTFTTQTFGRLLGNGTLRINTVGNPFPNVSDVPGSNFLQTGGGTVQYEGGAYTLPDFTTYNNLTIAGTGAKSFAPASATTFTLNGNLTVNSQLTIGGTGAAPVVTLNISGNLTVNSGATLNVGNASGTVQHAINLSGNLTNNGTIDLTNLAEGANPFSTNGGSARIRFTGATDNTVTLNVGHNTQFGNFIVNKGTGQTNVLHVIVQAGAANPQFWGNGGTTTPGGQRFVITNGILRLGANITIPNLISSGTGDYNLGGPETGAAPSTPGEGENGQLWNDGATISASGNALVVYGTYRQTAGSITCANQGLVVSGTGSVIIEGGVLNAEKYRPSEVSESNPRGSFRLHGGTVNINASFPGSSNSGYARFCMPYLDQVFIMTGGTLNIADPETSNPAANGLIDIRCLPSNISVTGGTINVTIPASGEARISSTAPFPNFNVNRTAGTGTAQLVLQQIGVAASGSEVGATMARPLTVLGDFTLLTGNSPLFNANNQNVTIGGTLNVQSGTTFRTGTNTVTFIGDGSDFITINGTLEVNTGSSGFYNLTVNRTSDTLYLYTNQPNQNFFVRGTLTLLGSAPLNDNGFDIYVIGNVVNSGVHQSTGSGRIVLAGSSTQTIGGNGSGQFGNLTLDNASNPGATLTANQTINGTLTLASSTCIFDINIYRLRINNGNTNAIQATSGFGNTCYIRVTANPTSPGVERRITGTGNYLFPIGEVDGTTNKYTPAEVNINTFTGDGYIAINPVDQELATTNSGGGVILSYYWRVRRSEFNAAPTVSMRFTYNDADVADINNNDTASYVPGRVLDESPFTRSADGGQDDVDGANRYIVFNGTSNNATFPGAGFALNVNANYTAGAAGRFTGTPTVYYSRIGATGIGSYDAYPTSNPPGAPRWHDPSTWSTSSHDGPAASTVPGPGDIVIIGPPGGAFHHVVVRGNPINTPVTAECAELRFNSPTGDPDVNYGPRLTVFPNCTANLTAVKNASGTAGIVMIFFNNSQFPNFNADLTEWSDGTGLFMYQMQEDNAGRLFPTGLPTVYPNLRFEGADGGNRVMILPSENWTVKQNCFIDHHAIVRLNDGTNGDLTIDKDLRLGRPTADRAGRLQFPGTSPNIRTLTIGRDLQFGGETTTGGNNGLVMGPGTANVEHRLRVGRNIERIGAATNAAELDLFTGANGPRAVLELFSSQNGVYNKGGNNADLWRIEMNKGTDTTATFSVNLANITASGATTLNGGSTKFLTLLNGRFILNTNLTLNLSSGGDPFQIPSTAGLILQNGTATVTGDGTGILLDGLLRIAGAGGTLDMGNGSTANTRYIQFGSSGNARLQLWNGTVRVNSQIRRSPFTTAGVLKYVQHGGTLTVYGQGALASRAKFDVPENPGSEFTMTGGTITLVRGGGTSYGDLYLRPPTASVTGGEIILNATGAGSNQTYEIDCNIALNALTITGSNAPPRVATGRLRINPLTLTNSLSLLGTLTISNNNSIFDANGLDVFIGGNLNNNNNSTATGLNVGGYRPQTATQTTTFNRAGAQFINSSAANLTNFANLVLTGGSGTLTLNRNIRVNSNLTINAGKTLNDNGNTATVLGNVTHNGTHTGSGSITLAGTVQQQLFGTGTYQNLTLSNNAGAKTNANTTVAGTLTLANGILDIGSNLLSLTNTSGTAVSGTFSNTRMIRTTGNNADQGVQKSYPAAASDFLFPIGTGTRYTPARLNVTATSSAGTIRVAPVNNVHPGVEFGTNVLRYYWIVRSTGFSTSSPPTVQHSYNDGGDPNLPVTGAPERVGRLNPDAVPAPNWDPIGGFTSNWTYDNTNRSITTTTGVNYINGDYTAGTSAEFSSIPVYTSIQSGNWENQATWTTTPATNTPPRAGSNVVINSGHTVTTQPNAIISATLNSGGSGYNQYDVLTVSGGTDGQVRVEQVGLGGEITQISLINGGTGYTTATGVATYYNGPGSGATVNIVASLGKVGNSVTINSGGTLNLGNTIGHNFSTIAGQGTLRLEPTGGGSYVFPGGSATGFLSSGGGTVEYSGSTNGDLPPTPTSYNNILFSNAAGSTASYPNVDLTLAGNLTVNGGGTVSNPDNRNITVGGNFNISNNSTYNAGNGTLSIGGNFTGSGSYTFNANGATMPITGRLTNTGTFNANTSTITISGADGGGSNYSFANTGTFNAGTGTVIFSGGSAQTLGGSLTTFNNLTINKSSNNLTLAGSTNQQVNGTLTLTNGNIVTGTNALRLGTASTVSGGSNSSFVQGNVTGLFPTSSATRRYPLGSGGVYRPLDITAQASGGTAELRGFIQNSAATNVTTTFAGGLANVSGFRYFEFQNSGNSLTVTAVENMRINSDDGFGAFNPNNTARIATAVSPASPVTWTGRTLVTAPNTLPDNLPTSVTTTPFSESVTATGIFYATLASAAAQDNPLPVNMLALTVLPKNGRTAVLEWETASEQDNLGFVLYRSETENGIFEELASYQTTTTLRGQGTKLTETKYRYEDSRNTQPGKTYFYKLVSVDIDGTRHEITLGGQSVWSVQLPFEYALDQNYPNPFNPVTTIQFSLEKPGKTVLEIYNILGQKVATLVDGNLNAGAYRYQWNASGMASGMYFYRLRSDNFVATKKMLLVK
jgi:fibronectin-binding autotransporter adhesin